VRISGASGASAIGIGGFPIPPPRPATGLWPLPSAQAAARAGHEPEAGVDQILSPAILVKAAQGVIEVGDLLRRSSQRCVNDWGAFCPA